MLTVPRLALAVLAASDMVTASDPFNWLTIMLQAPALGVLVWFMLRAEKKMEEQTKAQNTQANAVERNSQALMIAVLSLKHMDSNIAELAQTLKAQSENAQHRHEDTSR